MVAGKAAAKASGMPFQAVGDGDQDVGHATVLQVVEDLHPELGTLRVLDPQPEDVPRAVRQHTECQIDRLVANPRVLANFDSQGVEESDRIHHL